MKTKMCRVASVFILFLGMHCWVSNAFTADIRTPANGPALSVMLFGNSILQHGRDLSIGWDATHGMAASSQDKDYAHRLMDFYVKNKYGQADYSLNNIVPFERSIKADDNYDYTGSTLTAIRKLVRDGKPDIVNLQMGENVDAPGLTAGQYKNAIIQLIEAVQEESPGVKVMVCSSFWGGSAKVEGAKQAALEKGIPYTDLSVLNKDENKALGLFSNPGVAIHPNDLGMDRIAQMIWANMDPVIAALQPPVLQIVGEQTGTPAAGIPGSAAFPVTATGISDGTYSAVLNDAPAGVTGSVTIAGGSGTLTVNTTAATLRGTYPLTLTIGATTSNIFNLAVGKGSLDDVKYYPNPIQPSKGLTYENMNFSNISAGASIKIYTMLGQIVRELEADASGTAVWDGKNNAGEKAASGVYIVYMEDGDGNKKRIKIAVEK